MPRDTKTRRAQLLDELRADGYLSRAKARARRRKSAWNLILIPLALVGIGLSHFLLVWFLVGARNWVLAERAVPLDELVTMDCPGIAPILLFVIPLVGAIPLGLFFTNGVAWCIPPARRAFDKGAQGVWHASFREAQLDILLLARYLVSASVVLGLIGAFLLQCG
jgi:hypothetical protein